MSSLRSSCTLMSRARCRWSSLSTAAARQCLLRCAPRVLDLPAARQLDGDESEDQVDQAQGRGEKEPREERDVLPPGLLRVDSRQHELWWADKREGEIRVSVPRPCRAAPRPGLTLGPVPVRVA